MTNPFAPPAPSPQRGESLPAGHDPRGRGEGEPHAPALEVRISQDGTITAAAPLTMVDRMALDLLRRFEHLELNPKDGCWYPPNSEAWQGRVCIKTNVADYLCACGLATKRDAPPDPWARGIAEILVATEAGRNAA